jgi:alpha-1,2-mannosyltransferase
MTARLELTRAAIGLLMALAFAWALYFLADLLVASAVNGTLGYDYRAYDLAVDRLFSGQPLYDATATEFGPFGLFFYPPPFALLVVPVAALPIDVAIWTWTFLLIAATVAAIALLPVSRPTQVVLLLLAALSWPLVYSIKLGQVGPIVVLLFAMGWRWLDRPIPLGVSVGLGTVIKLQPALLIGWAALTGRRRAAVVAVVVVAALAALATIITGPQAWLDEASLLSRVSRPIETPHAFGVGRLAFEAGASFEVATARHWAYLALVALVVAFTVWRGSAVASYLSVAVATQFLSPVLWDHYAVVLLLPVAWLIDRRRWWAAVIPLATSTPLTLLGVGVPALYPIGFWVTLLALAWEGMRESRARARREARFGPGFVPAR